MTIETEHLELMPFSPEHLLAMIDSEERYEASFGLRPAPGLRAFLIADEVSPTWYEKLRTAAHADPWVHGFAVVHKETRLAVGTAAFKGPPDDDGVVEIAYGIVPDYEGRGYATEAAGALVRFAFADPRVRRVRAHTLPTPNASTRVLTKNGFAHLGEVVDPEDGRVWRWERGRNAETR